MPRLRLACAPELSCTDTVCTGGVSFEIGGGLGFSVETTFHTFLSAPACNARTDMVYSKEPERDVTTTAMAKAILQLKTLAFIQS